MTIEGESDVDGHEEDEDEPPLLPPSGGQPSLPKPVKAAWSRWEKDSSPFSVPNLFGRSASSRCSGRLSWHSEWRKKVKLDDSAKHTDTVNDSERWGASDTPQVKICASYYSVVVTTRVFCAVFS